LATGLSWLCYFRALQLGEASRVAPMDKLSVLFAILFAAVVLGETLTWHQWLGGGLVLIGAVILGLQIMKAAGCKSNESNQFSQLEIWHPRPASSIRIGGHTWLPSRTRLSLVKALEREARIELKVR